MSSFDGQDLFNSGEHRFHVGGLALRHVLQPVPGGRGVRVSDMGQHGRGITLRGDLLADDADAMWGLINAIEMKLDGITHILIDDDDQEWDDTVMLSFDPDEIRRVGARWRVPYEIRFLQVVG